MANVCTYSTYTSCLVCGVYVDDIINSLLLASPLHVQGNYYNQQVMFDRQIVDIINRILQATAFPSCEVADVSCMALRLNACLQLQCQYLCEEQIGI